VAKGLRRKPYDGETPRPSWRRYYQAVSDLLDEGGPFSEVAIAKRLGISRQSLWRIHRRNPGLKRWVHEQLLGGNEYLVGPVVRMLGTTAVRNKSPKHAELFLKATGTLEGSEPDDTPAGGVHNYTLNILVPRPDMGAIAPPVPALPAASTRTIEVRR
jgi:hypothetical protein